MEKYLTEKEKAEREKRRADFWAWFDRDILSVFEQVEKEAGD